MRVHNLADRERRRHRCGRLRVERDHDQMWARGLVASGARRPRDRKLLGSFERDDRARVAVAQVVCDLARLEQDVQRHDHAARFEDPEVGGGKRRQVRTGQRDVIAGHDSQRDEARGYFRGFGVELRVCAAHRSERDRDCIRRQHRGMLQDGREIEGGH
jgi:hypothetical protein